MDLERPKILIVDDEPAQIDLISKTLNRIDATLITAQSGAEAYKLAKQQQFATILMDVRMPDIGGIKAVELIRFIGPHKTTPIILLTSQTGNSELIQKAYKAGSIDYLSKPIDPLILESKVLFFLELHIQKQISQLQLDRMKEIETNLRESLKEMRTESGRWQKTEQQLHDLAKVLEQKLSEEPGLQSLQLLNEKLIEIINGIGGRKRPGAEDKFQLVSRNMELSSRNMELLETIDRLQSDNMMLAKKLSSLIHHEGSKKSVY